MSVKGIPSYCMTTEQIAYFLDGDRFDSKRPSTVFFKKRNPMQGMFIQRADYMELKKKNFWRIVTASRLEEYRRSNDINLSRIYNGDEFTKLAATT